MFGADEKVAGTAVLFWYVKVNATLEVGVGMGVGLKGAVGAGVTSGSG